MKSISTGHFYGLMHNKKEHFPWNGQIELTYRCNLNCIHCYCKGYALHVSRFTLHASGHPAKKQELTTNEWKEILDEVHKEGCLWLAFTGGEPLIRDDFLELYSYAKDKGFLITIFTNGTLFTDEIINHLAKSPPYSIEITLNGITEDTYESITQTPGSFSKVINNIKKLAEKEIKLILKTNCLKQNKYELGRIKTFTEQLLGKPSENKYCFKYDPMIYPRLNGDKTPTKYRLSFEELLEVKRQDADIWEEYQRGLHSDFPDLTRDKNFLYRCNAWLNQFFINPYGILKFCQFSEKFSSDLKKEAFKEGFYYKFPLVLKEKFKTNSKCKDCSLRAICYHCPARAYLETGNEEAPVPYYCELAKATEQQIHASGNMLHAPR